MADLPRRRDPCAVEHLGARLAVAAGRLDPTSLTPGPGWPALHQSYTDMAAQKGSNHG